MSKKVVSMNPYFCSVLCECLRGESLIKVRMYFKEFMNAEDAYSWFVRFEKKIEHVNKSQEHFKLKISQEPIVSPVRTFSFQAGDMIASSDVLESNECMDNFDHFLFVNAERSSEAILRNRNQTKDKGAS